MRHTIISLSVSALFCSAGTVIAAESSNTPPTSSTTFTESQNWELAAGKNTLLNASDTQYSFEITGNPPPSASLSLTLDLGKRDDPIKGLYAGSSGGKQLSIKGFDDVSLTGGGKEDWASLMMLAEYGGQITLNGGRSLTIDSLGQGIGGLRTWDNNAKTTQSAIRIGDFRSVNIKIDQNSSVQAMNGSIEIGYAGHQVGDVTMTATGNVLFAQSMNASGCGFAGIDAQGDVVLTNNTTKNASTVFAFTGGGSDAAAKAAVSIKANSVIINTPNMQLTADGKRGAAVAASGSAQSAGTAYTGSGGASVQISGTKGVLIKAAQLGVLVNQAGATEAGSTYAIDIGSSEGDVVVESGYAAFTDRGGTSDQIHSSSRLSGNQVVLRSEHAEAVDLGATGGKNVDLRIEADHIELSTQGEEGVAAKLSKNAVLSLGARSNGTAAKAVIQGSVAGDGTGSLSLNRVNATLSDGSTLNVSAIDATKGASSITFNTTADKGIQANEVKGDLQLIAAADITAQFGTGEAAARYLKERVLSGGAAETLYENLTGEESALTSAWKVEQGGVQYENGSAESPTLSALKHFNAANLAQWRFENNHLSERLGDVRSINGAVGTWARVYGHEAKVQDSVSTRVRTNSLQVGADVRVSDGWIIGAAVGYRNADADFSIGSAEGDGYSIALYGTGVFENGAYVDLIARAGRISSDVKNSVRAYSASYDNTTLGLSAEVGFKWDLSQTFYLTPQAELSYGFVKGDDYSVHTGADKVEVHQDDFKSLVGRLGFQAGANFAEKRGTVYLTASVNHDFQGETNASARQGTYAVQHLSEDLGGTWFSYGVGAQFNVKDNWSFYGSLTRANGSDYQENYHYTVGTRWVW